MTDKPAADTEYTLRLTAAQLGNLVQCVDLMRRHCAIEQVRAVMDLVDLLATAAPVTDAESPA